MGLSPPLLAVLSAALMLVGCASAPKPTLVSATISLATDANPDGARRASPLLLRVYELSGRAGFEAADVVSLLQQDRQVLGADVVSGEEWIMAPGESRAWNKALAPQTRFIGITAAYRDIERARWRAVVPVAPNKTNTLDIRAEALSLTAVAGAK